MLILGLLAFGMLVGWLAGLILGQGTKPSGRALIAGLAGSFLGGLLVSLLAGDGLKLKPTGLIGSWSAQSSCSRSGPRSIARTSPSNSPTTAPATPARTSRWQDHDAERPVAEGVGFEPTVGCPTHAFQACRFGRSRIPPGVATASAGGGQAICGTPQSPLRAAASRP